MNPYKLTNVLLLVTVVCLIANLLVSFLTSSSLAFAQEPANQTLPHPKYKIIEFYRIANMEKEMDKCLEDGWKLQQFGSTVEDNNTGYYALFIKE